MRIDVQRVYGNTVTQDLDKSLRQAIITTKDVNNIRPAEKSDIDNVAKNELLKNFDPDKIVTQKERRFFIKMFPESSEQLEKHVLFNRSGRLATPNISKGSIVDGRV